MEFHTSLQTGLSTSRTTVVLSHVTQSGGYVVTNSTRGAQYETEITNGELLGRWFGGRSLRCRHQDHPHARRSNLLVAAPGGTGQWRRTPSSSSTNRRRRNGGLVVCEVTRCSNRSRRASIDARYQFTDVKRILILPLRHTPIPPPKSNRQTS